MHVDTQRSVLASSAALPYSHAPRCPVSLFKAVDAGEEELGNGDLALLVRRFPAVNDLTVRFASRLTSAYEVLSQVGVVST